ncbi:MAG: ATP-binding protein [Pseudomonadota bacterium]
MTSQVARAAARSLVFTIVMVGLLYALNRPVGELSGALFVDDILLCAEPSCAQGEPVTLPLRVERSYTTEVNTSRFRLDPSFVGGGLAGVAYFPAAPRALSLVDAGFAPTAPPSSRNTSRGPLLIELTDADAPLVFDISWVAHEGLILHPFHIGPREAVQMSYLLRVGLTYGLALTSIILMLASFAICAAIYSAERSEAAFFWLAMSNGPGLLIGAVYLLPRDLLSPGYDLAVLILAADVYVAFILRFMTRFIGLDTPRLERANILGCGAHALCVLVVPEGYLNLVSAVFAFWAVGWALVILTVFQLNRERTSRRSFFALFGLLVLALALSCHDWMPYFGSLPWGPSFTGQALPTALGVATLWLVVQRLLDTLTRLEALNVRLDQTVAAKSQELEANYRLIAQNQTQAALDAERARIMVELHDGVGGHILNIMAYAEEAERRDPVLETALEDVVREIGIIMDSITSLDMPLDMILGGLRHRYEGLLGRLGVSFDWQVQGPPDLPRIASDQKMDVVRIVQEALNNVAKHARATQVRVSTTRHHLIIEDNGIGLSAPKPDGRASLSSGMGLRNMAQRAEQVGAELDMVDTGQGTRIALTWPDVRG